MAVSYPHKYEIKLYKQDPTRTHVKLNEFATGYQDDRFKPDSMNWNSSRDELIVLEYSGPQSAIGMYTRKFHVLSTHSTPFQHVRVIEPGQNVSGFCTLPTAGFNRLLFCICAGSVVAMDTAGVRYWSVAGLSPRGICADQRGYLYVMSGSDNPGGQPSEPALYILWHDGTVLQTVTRGELAITGVPSRVHWDQARGHLVTMLSQQTLAIINVTHLPGSYSPRDVSYLFCTSDSA